jgi:hypothetical protein
MKHQSIFSVYVVAPWTVRDGNLIGPVVAIREGVLCGSRGCILHSGHILEENAHKFENIPACVNHPVVNGEFVSIDHNDQTRSSIVGVLKKTRYDPAIKGIRGEIHISANHPRASEIQTIKEVSVGVFSDEVYTPGEFNGQEYSACSITYEPDHLSLLSDGQIGACDWESGCGIRNNSSHDPMKQFLTEVFRQHFQTLFKGGQKMNNYVEPLYPPGVGKKENPDLRKIQQEADRRGILLPTEFNRNPETKNENWNGGADEVQPMLPPGINR